MMLSELRRDFLRGTAVPTTAKQEEIAHQLFTYRTLQYGGRGRRINRFMLGADPEFVFETNSGEPFQATNAGLRPGLAFGSDQNDRLVELRPHPSRSALEVVASTLSELRWLYRANEHARLLRWRSGAFAHGDGMGGHVHFGRKRAMHRASEVQGLDGLAKTLRKAGVFPEAEWARRAKGDNLRQVYGQYGDIRPQKHGYEYRTLPSWLDSPYLAFLVLTLSKLVVVDPEITAGWSASVTPSFAWNRLQALARYYMGRDDDAWLLYTMMETPEPFIHRGGDFKSRWGISGEVTQQNIIFPASIRPQAEDTGDLLALFKDRTALPMRELAPNFCSTIPSEYYWILPSTNPNRSPGVGDLIYDLVTARDGANVQFQFGNGSGTFLIETPQNYKFHRELTAQMVTPALEGYIAAVRRSTRQDRFVVHVGREWRKGSLLAQVRQVLESGLLPVWTVDQVRSTSHADWVGRHVGTARHYKLAELLAA